MAVLLVANIIMPPIDVLNAACAGTINETRRKKYADT